MFLSTLMTCKSNYKMKQFSVCHIYYKCKIHFFLLKVSLRMCVSHFKRQNLITSGRNCSGDNPYKGRKRPCEFSNLFNPTNFILSLQCSDSGISLRSGRTVSRESSPAQNINNNKHAPASTPTQEIASLYKTEFAGETVFLQGRREVTA